MAAWSELGVSARGGQPYLAVPVGGGQGLEPFERNGIGVAHCRKSFSSGRQRVRKAVVVEHVAPQRPRPRRVVDPAQNLEDEPVAMGEPRLHQGVDETFVAARRDEGTPRQSGPELSAFLRFAGQKFQDERTCLRRSLQEVERVAPARCFRLACRTLRRSEERGRARGHVGAAPRPAGIVPPRPRRARRRKQCERAGAHEKARSEGHSQRVLGWTRADTPSLGRATPSSPYQVDALAALDRRVRL
jgi:hypothetical protein